METEIILNGRKYWAHVSPDEQQGAHVIIGPPEGLVDEMEIAEPFATTLHNVLYDRRIFTYQQISNMKNAVGVLQEALMIDAQKLAEAFLNFEKESVI